MAKETFFGLKIALKKLFLLVVIPLPYPPPFLAAMPLKKKKKICGFPYGQRIRKSYLLRSVGEGKNAPKITSSSTKPSPGNTSAKKKIVNGLGGLQIIIGHLDIHVLK